MTPPKKTILFFCEGISFAHIARSLIFVTWLEELGMPIMVACTDASAHYFRQAGHRTVPLRTEDPKQIYTRLRNGGAMYTEKGQLDYFAQDDRLIIENHPALIVAEFRFSALQLAKKYGIPCVGLTEATCHPGFRSENTLPDFVARKLPVPIALGNFVMKSTSLGAYLTTVESRKKAIGLQRASKRYGTAILPDFFEYASQGDICLMCDHPGLVPVSGQRPQDGYTGALIWERKDPWPVALNNLDPGRKTIYVCPGTQESLPTEFLSGFVKGLLDRGYQVIVSKGNRRLELENMHHDLYIFDFVNEYLLMPMVNLVVYPGGAMTTYQALFCDVPLLALPAHINQHFFAEKISEKGFGEFVLPSRVSTDKLLKVAFGVLQGSAYPDNTTKFGSVLRNYSGREDAIARIKALIG